MNDIVLYQADNLVNGKRYIGITRKGLKSRERDHRNSAARGSSNTRFANALRKYGEKIRFKVLVVCSDYEYAKGLEVSAISMYSPEYNLTKGGDGALGYKHSSENIMKMRMAKLGKPSPQIGWKRSREFSERCRARVLANPSRPSWTGGKRPQWHNDAISAGKRAAPYKPPTEKALAARRKNMEKCIEKQKIAVRCIDDGSEFPSIVDAARYYGIKIPGNITQVCRGHVKRAYGRSFEYINGGRQW